MNGPRDFPLGEPEREVVEGGSERPGGGLTLTGALGGLRRPDDAVQVENGQQVRLRLLQRRPQVLEVVPLLGQEQLEQQLRLSASRLLVQLPPLAGAQRSCGLEQPEHRLHLCHGLGQALLTLGEQLPALGLHGGGRPAPPDGYRTPGGRRARRQAGGQAGGWRRAPAASGRRAVAAALERRGPRGRGGHGPGPGRAGGPGGERRSAAAASRAQ